MVEGDLDFSCIEAIMIMFPSILWLDMMKMGTEYTKKKVMNGFLCRPTQGTFHRVCQTANVLCDSLPTWQDFVGDHEELKDGINRYVLVDCTPSTKQLLSDPTSDQEVQEKLDSKSIAIHQTSLLDTIQSLLEDMSMIHQTTSSNCSYKNLQKRVVVDNILFLIRTEISQWRAGKKNEVYTFPLVWKMMVYFRTIFILVGKYDHAKFEAILRHHTVIAKCMLTIEIVGKIPVKFYHRNDLETLNKTIFNNIPAELFQKLMAMSEGSTLNTTYQTPVDLLEDLNQFDLEVEHDDFPSTSFITFVENRVKRMCQDRQSLCFQQWPAKLTKRRRTEPSE